MVLSCPTALITHAAKLEVSCIDWSKGVARGGNSLEPRRERKLKHPPTLDA